MADGLFNVARKTIYHDTAGFSYGPSTHPVSQSLARKIYAWIGSRYKYTPRQAKVSPVFLIYRDSVQTGSYWHLAVQHTQTDAAIHLIMDLMSFNTITAGDIVVTTPYRDGVRRVCSTLRKPPALADVAVHSTNSCQGMETQVVDFLMCVDGYTGPLFLAHTTRLCSAITRHTSALFVVVDTCTVNIFAGDSVL
ncbi:hypothetical protein SEUCBS140593_003628 [Sporothrix eucalyptigena]|uniref:DNA2/NAM7 helicase-like C-terminal domain-containing protein n=1 Tax=Sporothrix eucalyptigena TaxID=1812306 RepID=A0ABP0BGB7_9PEZI